METINNTKEAMEKFLCDAECGIIMIDELNTEKYVTHQDIIETIQYDKISTIHIIDDNTLQMIYDDNQYILEAV